jgi:hypothetical protein
MTQATGQAINHANIGSNLRELGKLEMYQRAQDLDPILEKLSGPS